MEETMEIERSSEIETEQYSTQRSCILGFDSEVVLSDSHNVVQDYCSDAMEDFSKSVRGTLVQDDEASVALFHEGVRLLHAKLIERSKVKMQLFENYARENCFSIPCGLVAGQQQDAGTDLTNKLKEYAQEEEDGSELALTEELQELRCKIAKARSCTADMRRQAAELTSELEQCGDMHSRLAAMSSVIASGIGRLESEKANLSAACEAVECLQKAAARKVPQELMELNGVLPAGPVMSKAST
ncbi:hypothetical protein CYMTET_25771 [Cymbomonas tetramitiformis]|uniref:Uncharacterized protein n=1 Tax=Cymbomonas tetramitiformis TaxID=36881 RepID=A0AAE0FTD7_9CHLO|nr:hypothetical protein CYMTET_25771 [Cymbomonas tetramitiformis]